jgi:glycosyltransferase involved in cell wall biosynthesis
LTDCPWDARAETDRPGRLRVLSIAHTAVRRDAGRKRYKALARKYDIDLTLLVPARWYENGRWIDADPPQADIRTIISPIRFGRAGRAGWYLHYYPGLAAIVEALRPDVIHLWEEPWSVVAAHAVWLRNRRWRSTAIVLEVDQNIDRGLPPPFERMRRYTLRHTDHVLGRHPDALSVARSRGYSRAGSIIEYGLDHTVFRPGSREEARAAYALDGFTLGYVGRLVPEKGIDDALAALALCHRRISLLILGDGPDRARLMEMSRSLGITDRVRFYPPADAASVARFMNAIDALVLLTRTTSRVREQFGRVIMEAQACGVPVIGSTCGAIPDVIGQGGWIVPEGAPAAAAACFERVADHPEMRRLAAAAGREQACRRFTFDVVADALWLGLDAAVRSRRAMPAAADAAEPRVRAGDAQPRMWRP